MVNVTGPRHDQLNDSPRRLCRLAPWTVLLLAVAGMIAPYIVSAVREAREEARHMPYVGGFSNWPGCYEILGSGSPQAEVMRALREGLESLRRAAREQPTALRFRVTQLDASGLEPLCRFEKLTSLAFTDVTLDSSVVRLVSRLPRIRCLHLAATGIGDRDVQWLAEMRTLERLDVSRTSITADGLQDLRLALPQCTFTVD